MGLHGAAPHAAKEGDPGYDGEPGSGRGGSGSGAGLRSAPGREGTGGAGGPRRDRRCRCGSGWCPGCGQRVAQRAGLLGVSPGECSAPSSLPSGGSGGDAAAESSPAAPSRVTGWQRRRSDTGCAQRPPVRTAPRERPLPSGGPGGRAGGGSTGCTPGEGWEPSYGHVFPVPWWCVEVNGHVDRGYWRTLAGPRCLSGTRYAPVFSRCTRSA